MAISTETVGRLYASGRNYISLAVGFASGVGILSAAQDKGLMDALAEMYNGVSLIVHGATSAWTILVVVAAPIVGPIVAKLASRSAKVENQAPAVLEAIKDPNTPITSEVKAIVLQAATEVKKI